MFEWLDAVRTDSIQVVTASRRLARALQAEYAQQMLADGRTAWRSPAIHYWQDWLTNCLADCSAPATLPIRISSPQCRVLWERCLRREISDPLLNIGMLARQSQEAWNSLHDWRVSLADCQRTARNRDQGLFAKAATGYQSILRREHWVDDAGMAELAAQEMRAGRVRLHADLMFAGFDRLTPLQQLLADAVRDCGHAISFAPGATDAADPALHVAESHDAELRAAGAWARQQLLQAPEQRVAIIVTQLEQGARRSLRLIKEGLLPGWQNASPAENAVVNVSYGQKLADFPAIATALLALRWLHSDLRTTEISRLLLTTLLGATPNDDLTRIELRLRLRPEQSWSPAALLAEISSWRDVNAIEPALQRVRKLAARRTQLPPRQSPAGWVELFAEVLQDLQWPGSAALDSEEFQLLNRWRELLNEVARLQLVSPSMSAAEALAHIATMATEAVFQPESEHAIVQIMGPLEAAGLQFDRLWITGVSNRNWPPPARPLSLLSRELQRDAGMPDATPDDTLAFAQRVLRRLVTSAPQVVLSYPATQDDAPQSPSELLQGVTLPRLPLVSDPGWNARRHAVGSSIVAKSVDRVPPVSPGELVSGGAATIQRQLQDPFSAFAAGRLGVRPLRPITAGLPASLRGSLIHAALHRLYADCPSGAEIRAWDVAEIARRGELSVQAAFGPQERHADPVLRRLLQLEKARVRALLASVIALDASRDEFRIRSVEQRVATSIAGIQLRLRVDRIDICNDGELLIADYKTGAARQLLDRERQPKDMQLVVYSCAIDEPVGAIALINVDSRAVEMLAVGREQTPEIDWEGTLAQWQSQVEAAALQMAAGDVRIGRHQGTQAARPFALLSRYQELLYEQ